MDIANMKCKEIEPWTNEEVINEARAWGYTGSDIGGARDFVNNLMKAAYDIGERDV